MKSNTKIKLVIQAVFIIMYMYYVIYYVNDKTPINKKIKKVMHNHNFLFITSIIVILGIFNLINKNLYLLSKTMSFIIPMTLIVIDV